MTDFQPPTAAASTDSTPPPTRIGSAERQQAMDALDVHMSAGRLDPDEYGERVGQASVARTTADLESLFTDLPLPHAGGPATAATWGLAQRPGSAPSPAPAPASAPAPAWSSPAPAPALPARQRHNGRAPLGGRIGEVAVGASPFIAVILFFSTVGFFDQAWLFFLLIPIVGVVVYGHDWHDDDRRRDRRRFR